MHKKTVKYRALYICVEAVPSSCMCSVVAIKTKTAIGFLDSRYKSHYDLMQLIAPPTTKEGYAFY